MYSISIVKGGSFRIWWVFGESRSFGGFALISSLMVLALLTMVAIAFLSLANLQMKSSRSGQHQAEAEANARLALMIAIGELQREMGPDQRVSATSGLESSDGIQQKYWTAVYRTTQKNGEPFLSRDDLNGGLRDSRIEGSEWDEPLNYLVSGNEGGLRTNSRIPYGPAAIRRANGVTVVGGGSTNGDPADEVKVPRVGVFQDGTRTGSYGFWVGDLGVKANIAVTNPHDSTKSPEKYFALLGGIGPEASAIESGGTRTRLEEGVKLRLVSEQSLDFVHESGADWRRSNFHNVTVHSQGVLANSRDGGLQKNLSVFLNQSEDIDPVREGGEIVMRGLSAYDNLVGPANEAESTRLGLAWEETRHTLTSPKFGLLRDWARLGDAVTLADNEVDARLPKTEVNYKLPDILEGSSQNLNPVTLTEVDHASLAPILVEGSMFNTFSTHRNPAGSRYSYNIRSHDFPRVVLWNPYSIPVTLPGTVAMLQINGRRGFRTDAWRRTANGVEFPIGFSTWLSFGGRTRPDGPVIGSSAYEDAYTGSFYFHLEETTFQPGECLVFLPDQAAEYDEDNVLNNSLSPWAAYDFANNYYHSASEFDEENPEDVGGMDWYPKKFWYTPSDSFFGGEGQLTQSDDSQMILKKVGTLSEVAPLDFDNLPQIAAVSCSLQFGAGREPPEAWYHDPSDPNSGVDIEFLDMINPVVTLPPDRRTRQGYRMRWFREHDSNMQAGDNGLEKYPEAWEEAFLANWNLRAAYASRSPFENLIGNRGDGIASGPWFFGIYTKDLYDEEVSWVEQTPFKDEDDRNLGNPFGPPSEGARRNVLFDVPRGELGILSLAQFQHAKISEYVWHPSYAIGNSLVDPRLGLEGRKGTAPVFVGDGQDRNGFFSGSIGWSSNSERGGNREAWADHGIGLFHDVPETSNIVYDLSFEVNHKLWDEYFLSSGNDYDLLQAAQDELVAELPNPRMKPVAGADFNAIGDFHRAGLALMNEGAFNVNSTNVEAWKAVLSANRREDGRTPFPRIVGGDRPEWASNEGVTNDLTWDSTRVLSDDEIERLALAVVEEVKKRGPFLSLSDFVNRRLSNDENGEKGALEAAISRAGLNFPLDQDGLYALNNERSLGDYEHPDNIADSTQIEQTLKPKSKAWGAPSYLTQADVLQAIGAGLSARSDTFVIRAYGESLVGGKIKARAWCEAIVQRLPEPLRPDATGINPDQANEYPDFGRRFKIKSFRWLNANEI
jgi:type II secretory pathway pseudopilin PulG